MASQTSFPYQWKQISEGKLANPIIYLKVGTLMGTRKIGFLVDSGSDTTVFPISPYRYLFGFRPKEETKIKLGGVEGKGVDAYPSTIEIQIAGDKVTVRCFFVKSDTLPLLGRLDLWDKYNWTFDNKRGKVVFEKFA